MNRHFTSAWHRMAPSFRPGHQQERPELALGASDLRVRWWRRRDLNPRPSGYERAEPRAARPLGLLKTEDGEEGFVDPPQLLSSHMISELTESGGIHGADLLDEDPRRLIVDEDLWAKGRWSSASRRRCHEDDGPWQQLVSLDDYAESSPSLFMAATLGQP
jgi:hypothetical protein